MHGIHSRDIHVKQTHTNKRYEHTRQTFPCQLTLHAYKSYFPMSNQVANIHVKRSHVNSSYTHTRHTFPWQLTLHAYTTHEFTSPHTLACRSLNFL